MQGTGQPHGGAASSALLRLCLQNCCWDLEGSLTSQRDPDLLKGS